MGVPNNFPRYDKVSPTAHVHLLPWANGKYRITNKRVAILGNNSLLLCLLFPERQPYKHIANTYVQNINSYLFVLGLRLIHVDKMVP